MVKTIILDANNLPGGVSSVKEIKLEDVLSEERVTSLMAELPKNVYDSDLWLEPIYDLSSGECVGFDVILYWADADDDDDWAFEDVVERYRLR